MKRNAQLVSIAKIQSSKRQVHDLNRIDAEDCDLIIYLTKKELSRRGQSHPKEYYEAGCTALKQYYALTVFDPLNMHAISDTLDPFWHSHILDTVSYDLLGKDIKGFMHHDPLNHLDIIKVAAVKKIYGYTRKVLSDIFGEENLDDRFHPAKMTTARMVCLHDIEPTNRRLASLKDILPLNPDIQKYRVNYSHDVRRMAVTSALRAEFRKEA